MGVYDVQLTDCGKEWLGRVVTDGSSETKVLEEGKPVKTVDDEDLVKKEQDLLVRRYNELPDQLTNQRRSYPTSRVEYSTSCKSET